MKNFLRIFAVLVITTLNVYAQCGAGAEFTCVPDDAFEGYLISIGIDDVLDGRIRTSNAANQGQLIMSDLGIRDLTGIEAFSNLSVLNVQNNDLAVLDLSGLPNIPMDHIRVDGNENLEQLDLAGVTSLQTLGISNTALEDDDLTDVHRLFGLRSLYIANTGVHTIDFTRNTGLVNLDFGNNDIDYVDLSHHPLLEELLCSNAQLGDVDSDYELDLSSNPNLTQLRCNDNSIESIDLRNCEHIIDFRAVNNNLRSLDLRHLTDLSSLLIHHNNLEHVDLRNGNNMNIGAQFDVTGNPNLMCVEVDDPAWSKLNWTNVDGEDVFDCAPEMDCPNLEVSFQTYKEETCLDEQVTFNYTGTWVNIGTMEWYINDELVGTGSNLTHRFNEAGNQEIALVVTDQDGCAESAQIDYHVVDLANDYDIVGETIVCNDEVVHYAVVPDNPLLRVSAWIPGGIVSDVTKNGFNVNYDESFKQGQLTVQLSHTQCNNRESFRFNIVDECDDDNGPSGITGPSRVCSNGNTIYTFSTDAIANNYSWTVVGPTLSIVGHGTNTVEVEFSEWFTSGPVSVGYNGPNGQWIQESIQVTNTCAVGYCGEGTDYTCVPDEAFEGYLIVEGIDDVPDGRILTANAANRSILFMSGKGIHDLTGIEAFVDLGVLEVQNNNLTRLDLSGLPNIQMDHIRAYGNEDLVEMDLSGIATLRTLRLNNTSLEDDDLSDVHRLTGLQYFSIANTQVHTINFSNNTGLMHLICWGNDIDFIDVSHHPLLSKLHCYDSQLGDVDNNFELDVSSNPLLKDLRCGTNSIESINFGSINALSDLRVSRNNLTELDLTNQTGLWIFWAHNNNLEHIDLRNGNNRNISHGRFNVLNNPNLSCIEVDDPVWSRANWLNVDDENVFGCGLTYVPDDNFEAYLESMGYGDGEMNDYVIRSSVQPIINLDISDLNITDLTGIQDFENLETLRAHNNILAIIDLSNNTKLKDIRIGSAQLTGLDVSNNTALEVLQLQDNEITDINLSNNEHLRDLRLRYNNLTSLDLTQNPNLEFLSCHYNDLQALDVSSNPNLTTLRCEQNPGIGSLNLSNNDYIRTLLCANTGLSTLNLDNLDFLVDLNCGSNLLTELDLSHITTLREVRVQANFGLSEIDVSASTPLRELNVFRTNISSLDVTQNTNLVDLEIAETPMTEIDLSQNLLLNVLEARKSMLVSLDLSLNEALTTVRLHESSQLTQVNIKNGHNHLIASNKISLQLCPVLTCIQVDDEAWSETNWTRVDDISVYSENCYSANARMTEFNLSSSAITVFPNPAQDVLIISGQEGATYLLTDLTGVEVLSGQLSAGETLVDVSSLSTGVYMLTTQNESGIITYRVIKE